MNIYCTFTNLLYVLAIAAKSAIGGKHVKITILDFPRLRHAQGSEHDYVVCVMNEGEMVSPSWADGGTFVASDGNIASYADQVLAAAQARLAWEIQRPPRSYQATNPAKPAPMRGWRQKGSEAIARLEARHISALREMGYDAHPRTIRKIDGQTMRGVARISEYGEGWSRDYDCEARQGGALGLLLGMAKNHPSWEIRWMDSSTDVDGYEFIHLDVRRRDDYTVVRKRPVPRRKPEPVKEPERKGQYMVVPAAKPAPGRRAIPQLIWVPE